MTGAIAHASPDAVIRALEAHERGLALRWGALRGTTVEDRPDMLFVLSGRQVAWTNGVYYARFDLTEADRRIAETTDRFRAAAVPAIWRVMPDSEPPDLAKRLESQGWRYHDRLPYLAADIGAIPKMGQPPRGLVIERARDERTQGGWESGMEGGFGMPKGDAAGLFALARRSGFDPAGPWVRFGGFLDGEPVASSGLLLFGGIAGVYNVATMPRARRLGIGTAMTQAAVDHARSLGYGVAVLGTSDIGRGIYERLGFREVVVIADYIWEPA